MPEDNKVTGEFYVQKTNGPTYVLKHVDTQLMAVVEGTNKYLDDGYESTEDALGDIESGNYIKATLVSPESVSDTVWMFQKVDVISDPEPE